MEKYNELKKISGDSVLVEPLDQSRPTICKTIGGATYVARMHFNQSCKQNISDKMLRLMKEELQQLK